MIFLLKLVQTNAQASMQSTAALQNATRLFATRLSATKIADVEKKLGFPQKPKRPLHPFLRFSKDLRPTLKDVGNRKATDVVIELAALWRGTDDARKAIYQQQFAKDLDKYRKDLFEYKSKLSDEQLAQRKNELQLLRAYEKKKQEAGARRAVEQELGKPKRPPTAFFLYAKDAREKSPAKITPAEIGVAYNTLNDVDRKVYIDQAAKLYSKYRQNLEQWEEKMVNTGNLDVLRSSQAPEEPKKTAASTKRKPKSKPKKSE